MGGGMDRENIAGKVVVITGASSGLGDATARHLAERGAIVVLGARRVDRLDALVDAITNGGGKALAVATDVTDAAQVQRLIDTAVERFGRIVYGEYAIPPSSFARAVAFAIGQPEDVDVNEILFRPTRQAL